MSVKSFQALVELLPSIDVEEVVCDFEAAIWKAVKEVLPDVNMKGCSFHWGQALWRHVQVMNINKVSECNRTQYTF